MTMDDFKKVVKAERERLRVLADGKDAYFFNCWLPDSGPDVILPPDQQPEIPIDLLLDGSEVDYSKMYYRRSGRFLGTYATREESDKADPYRFSRTLLPGGRLPWEIKEEENKNEQNY